jgi:NAD(P)-dependent dehydrogenase (short-subunit alcohol dehydrogenase family)
MSNIEKRELLERFLKGDVAPDEEVSQLIKDKGDIDIIINNAGVSRFSSILDITVEEFDKVLDINLRPIFITSRTLAKHRDANPELNSYGRIINIASTRFLMSEPNSEAYAASKGGIYSLTHALSMSLSKYRIIVNSISPGWIETGNYELLSDLDHNQHPSGRVGKPEDIARTCIFLCESDNDFINGQNIVVDGGMTKKMIYL